MKKRGQGGGRTLKILGILNTFGDVLLLQLCFAVASLGVVTAFPAAIALQRCLDDVLYNDENAGIRSFGARLAAAFRRYWAPSIALPVLTVMLVVGILFWAFAEGPVGLVALALLIPIAGLSLGLYLCALAVLVSAREESTSADPTSTELLAAAWARLLRQPLHVAGCVIVMVTWILLLLQVPTLILIGSGVVPAFLAFWLRRGATRGSVGSRTRG